MSKSERTKKRILDAAASMLATGGYAGTSLTGIADQIGMRHASLYYHFSSKDELVIEVLRQGTLRARESVAEALIALGDQASAREALRAAIVAHLGALLAQGPYTTANVRSYGQLPPDLTRQHLEFQRSYGTTWRELIRRGVDNNEFRQDLDQRAMRLMILGAMNWTIEWFDESNDLGPEQLGHQLADMVLDGLVEPS